jgi:hypothetical protein
MQASQEQVYRECCARLVVGVVEGVSGTVLAYGCTGSGKTYSMGMQHVSSQHQDASRLEPWHGIVPRAVHHLFNLISQAQAEEEGMVFHVTCTLVGSQLGLEQGRVASLHPVGTCMHAD